MKIIYNFTLIFTITISLFSCGNHKEKKDDHTHNTEVKLDEGKLWVANSETTEGINNMLQLMNAYSTPDDLNSYPELKINLEKEFQEILSKCTMQGESHNQLHNFLVPMKENFEGLNSKDVKICKENYTLLNKHLKEYSNYFK